MYWLVSDLGIWVLSSAGARDYFVLENVQTGSAAHPVSFSEGTGCSSGGVEWLGHEINELLVQKLGMSGTIFALLHMPSRLARGLFYIFTFC